MMYYLKELQNTTNFGTYSIVNNLLNRSVEKKLHENKHSSDFRLIFWRQIYLRSQFTPRPHLAPGIGSVIDMWFDN